MTSPTRVFCPDDGLILHEATRGILVCHCGGTLLTRDSFQRDVRELLEAELPRSTEPDLACPRCSHITSLLRVGDKERFPHWCENCNAVWLRPPDVAALAELRREKSAPSSPAVRPDLLTSLREAFDRAMMGPPPQEESVWDPTRFDQPRRFQVNVGGMSLRVNQGMSVDDFDSLAVSLINLLP